LIQLILLAITTVFFRYRTFIGPMLAFEIALMDYWKVLQSTQVRHNHNLLCYDLVCTFYEFNQLAKCLRLPL